MLRRKFVLSFNNSVNLYNQRRRFTRKFYMINFGSQSGPEESNLEIKRLFNKGLNLLCQCRNVHEKHQLKDKPVEPNTNSFTHRTHTCGELRSENEGENVVICGWVQYSRLSKFLLLRDAYGITQCVISNSNIDLSHLTLETVVKIKGTVSKRPRDKINTKMTTGEIEVLIDSLDILNTAEGVPFNLRDYHKPKEQLRMQHRYIDLRFPEMQNNLRLRSLMLHNIRRFLVEKHSFVEVETPTLFCRTPGGAREFVVPTRHSGLFYSLVQSPQQFKQMLMCGGIDRYFQIARCYRDETTRPDRQPEFTQLDIELSFTDLDGVLTLIEQLLQECFLHSIPKVPYKRLTYKYALENYGSDQPNLSYELKLENITHLLQVNSPKIHAYTLPYPAATGKLTAKYKEKLKEISKKYKTKIVLHEAIVKEFSSDILTNMQGLLGLDNFFVIAQGDKKNACLCLGEIREMIAGLLKERDQLKIQDSFQPIWIIDFPLFVEEDGKLQTCHHPFTAPHPDDLHLLETDPLKARSLAYDLVMKGNEVGGGSVRVHDINMQLKLLKMLNIDSEKLSHFLNALKSGCPPHGGIALGIDRLMAKACNTGSIRDVIAFPKSHDGKDPMSGAPNAISEDDQKYYHLNVK